ncbi:MAG: hypothetical protein IMF03_07900, partial [Proteobacteria bacterium]|nr:hypothetical protein [Pseudomonadota bacterium]
MSSTESSSRSDPIALMAALPGEGELLLSNLQHKQIILKGDFEIHTGKLAGR